MKKAAIISLSMLFMGFSQPEKNIRTEYYYNLRYLKNSGPPEIIKLVNTGNLTTHKPIISKGILFTYKNRKAASVFIAGNFSNWRMRKMTRNDNGVWYYFLDDIFKSSIIKYKFNVDSIWIMDTVNPLRRDDGAGSYISLSNNFTRKESRLVSYKIINKNIVEFRIFRPKAKFISLVGDFNNWNPENDPLLKGNDGIWRLRKRIAPGQYLYKFIVDGKWEPDRFNKDSASDITGNISSILKIE